jgi:beta-lactamase regulating signal transducer with metallopeptidase domain
MNILIDTALKGSILIAAAAAASYFLRGRSAAARHAAWTAAVIGHLALPALSIFVPQWNLGLISEPTWMKSTAAAPATRSIIESAAPENASIIHDEPASAIAPVVQPSTPSTVVEQPSWIDRIRSTNVSPVTLLWLIGSALVLLRLAIGTWKVGRLAKQGARVDDGEWLSLTQRLANRLGISRPLTLLRGDRLAVPVTWGVVYPAVLLPPDSNEWPEERRRFVLVHEMAHVKRFDALTQLVAQIAIAVFWFDPLIWLAAHRMRVEREHACDDYVIRDGTKPSLYAGELLEMVQSIGTPSRESSAPAFAALAMARRSEFEGRMLAILDSRQDRQTLSRRSTAAASVLLALLVLPLAALRPFGARAASAETVPEQHQKTEVAKAAVNDGSPNLNFSENACDSAMRVRSGTISNLVHTDSGEEDGIPVLEYMSLSNGGCTQAAFVGKTVFANDRLISLGNDESFVTIAEVTPSTNRSVRITRRANGTIEFSPRRNGAAVGFDDSMRAWLGRLLPEILTEAGIDAPQRVSRDLARGGVNAVLTRIAGIKSTSSQRAHYEALLDGKPLTSDEYDRVARHASRYLASSPSDLQAVLTRIAAGPAKGTKSLGAAIGALGRAQEALATGLDVALNKSRTSSDTASALTQYGVTDDPDMLLLALQGAADMGSDTDKRVLLQTLAAGSLRRSNPALRKAFFGAADTFSSDSDLRVVLQTALAFGHSDPSVTENVLRLVADRMSSDEDKRVVLVTAAAQRLIKTARARTAFMTAAKSMSSESEFATVMQSLPKQ